MTIAILAGGKSQRLGQDKAALFLPTLQAAASATGYPVLVVGRDPLPDTLPGQGPLGGLATALRHTDGPVLMVACDMPALDTAAFLWLIGEWNELSEKPHGLITGQEHAGQLEPLFAIYSPTCLPQIDHALETGRRSLHGLIGTGGFVFVEAPPELIPKLTNINTPDDLAHYSIRKP